MKRLANPLSSRALERRTHMTNPSASVLSSSGQTRSRLPWYYWALLVLVVAASVPGNLHWIQRNVLFVGHDSTSYMNVALGYRDFLYPLTPQSIFRAVHRTRIPPARHLPCRTALFRPLWLEHGRRSRCSSSRRTLR